MAKKPTISTVATGYQATDTINNNFTNVRNQFDNTLSRDGSTPNAMEADLDLNSNNLLNVNTLSAEEIILDGTPFSPFTNVENNIDDVINVSDNMASVTTVSTNINNVNIAATNVSSIQNFSNVYLGAHSTDPTTRTNGSALQIGDMYFNTALNRMKSRGASAWYTTDVLGATDASLVAFSPTGTISSSNVQSAIAEVNSDLAAQSGSSIVGVTATGYITSSTVQGAFNQVVAATPVPAWEAIKIRMRLGRVDFVGIGDSNQIFNGNGWDHGIQYALSQQFPMWATGLISQNENNGNGASQGYGYNRTGSLIGASSGAPAFFDNYLNKGLGSLFPANYTYVADGSSTANNIASGLILGANCQIDNGAALELDIHYGTFDTGSGAFRASVRLEESPFSLIVSNAIKNTNTGTNSMAVETVTLTADSSRASKAISLKPISVNVTGITGPYFNTYYRARNPSRTSGWSYGTLDFRGGQSLRTMAYDLQQCSDTTLAHYFGILRSNQTSGPKTIVVCVNSGLNDRNETLASVGPGAVSPGDSAAAFVDNFTALQNRLTSIWTTNNWDLNELFFLIYVSHPVSAPDDNELISYRTAIFNYARSLSRTQIISMTDLTTSTEMTTNSWYVSAGDKNHLSIAGYENLGLRIIDKLQ
jgi:hypothetical protein